MEQQQTILLTEFLSTQNGEAEAEGIFADTPESPDFTKWLALQTFNPLNQS